MWLAQLKSTLKRYQMVRTGDGVVAGLSGGPDSTALLCLLVETAGDLDLRIHGAHYNHGLRGSEADADEAFVREQCRRHGVPFSSDRAVAGPDAGENMEQWAREARYRFLLQLRDDLGFRRVAVGHTRDDLAETLLMRLIRGSGGSGLACLRPVRGDGVIRPLIDLSRSELLALLEERGEPWREDPSNSDQARVRNRVRHELIPLLERKYNPGIRGRLAATVGLLSDDDDLLERQAGAELTRLTEKTDGGELALSRQAVHDLPAGLARRVVRLALRRSAGHLLGLDRSHVEAALGLAAPGDGGEKRVQLPGDLVVRASYDRLIFEAGAAEVDPGPWSHRLDIPGRTALPEGGLLAVATLGPGPSGPEQGGGGWPDVRHTVLLDGDAARAAGLVLRSCRPGDRYCPAGAPGSRRVSRMLVDDRVPRYRRWRVPLLAAGDEPVWLPGHRPAESFCWRPGKSETCLCLELKGNG